MPSGAKKRKAAKKKQVHNPSSSSSASTNPIQGENDGGELNSPTAQDPSIEVEKVEDEKNSKDEGSNTKSSSSSSSDSSDDESRVVDKEVVVTESVPVVEPESLAPIVDEPVKEVEPLVEEVSHAIDEKKDLVAPVAVEEETVVVNETDSKEDCPTSSEVVEPVLKESEVEKLPLSDEKACVEKEDVASSTPTKDSISEVNGANGANETDTAEHSDRQAPVASAPLSVQKTTSWKSCCGLFDLFSGSER